MLILKPNFLITGLVCFLVTTYFCLKLWKRDKKYPSVDIYPCKYYIIVFAALWLAGACYFGKQLKRLLNQKFEGFNPFLPRHLDYIYSRCPITGGDGLPYLQIVNPSDHRPIDGGNYQP